MVRASDLLHRAVDKAHEDLHALISRTLPGQDYEDRRAEISRYVHQTRRALTQLLVLLEWLSSKRDATGAVLEGGNFIQSEAERLRVILDRFFYMHRDLFRKQVASRPYDLATTLDVLARGTTFPRFPRELDLSRLTTLDKEAFSVVELEHAIHSSLIIEQVPTMYSEAKVEDGVLRLVDANNFALCLTLESPDPSSAPWRLLDLQFLLPPQGGHDTKGNVFHSLEPDLRQRKQIYGMLLSLLEKDPEPLLSTYKLCRSLCNGLRLEMLALQAKELGKGDWEGRLLVDDSSARQLDITFWKGALIEGGAAARVGEEEEGGGKGGVIIKEEKKKEQQQQSEKKAVVACVISVSLVEEGGLQHLRATCSYGSGSNDNNGANTFRLSIKAAYVSVMDLLRESFQVLVPRRLQLLHGILEKDSIVAALVGKSHIKVASKGPSLEVVVWGTPLSVGVDSKSGRFLVVVPSCRGFSSIEFRALLDDWQESLEDSTTTTNSSTNNLSSSLAAFHAIVQHLFLAHVEVTASVHYELVCDRRWQKLQPFNLKLAVAEEEEEEEEKNTTKAASTYFLLQARSSLLQQPQQPQQQPQQQDITSSVAVGAFGEEWFFLEIETLSVVDPAPRAYLVTASLSRRNVGVPRIRSRQALLTSAQQQGDSIEAWFGEVLPLARTMMKARMVVDSVATALGLPRIAEEVFEEQVMKGKHVDFTLGNSGGGGVVKQEKKEEKEGEEQQAADTDRKMNKLSVQRKNEQEWSWVISIPMLERSSFAPNTTFTTKNNGSSQCVLTCTYLGPPGVLEMTFHGKWDPLVQAVHLSQGIAAVARFSLFSSSFSKAPSPASFTLAAAAAGDSSSSSFHQLTFHHTTGAEVTLRHSVFHLPVAGHDEARRGGRFYLSFTDPGLRQTRAAGAWKMIEDEFQRSVAVAVAAGDGGAASAGGGAASGGGGCGGSLTKLLERVETWLLPLQTVGGALQQFFQRHHFDLVPWSFTTVAMTCPRAPAEEGLLLLTVLPQQQQQQQQQQQGGGDTQTPPPPPRVRMTTSQGQGGGMMDDGGQQNEWDLSEFNVGVVKQEIEACFGLVAASS